MLVYIELGKATLCLEFTSELNLPEPPRDLINLNLCRLTNPSYSTFLQILTAAQRDYNSKSKVIIVLKDISNTQIYQKNL